MPKRDPDVPPVSARQFADLLGVHHNTVGNWLNAGMPALERTGTRATIALGPALQWIRARDKEDLDKAREGLDEEGAKARKMEAEATLKELDVKEREGRLVAADEVQERWSEMLVTIRESVMAVPGTAVQLGLCDRGKEQGLEAVCRDALVSAVEKKKTAAPAEETPAP
jgi:phage terminase Nu1 subunit (DNA packaging protein)